MDISASPILVPFKPALSIKYPAGYLGWFLKTLPADLNRRGWDDFLPLLASIRFFCISLEVPVGNRK